MKAEATNYLKAIATLIAGEHGKASLPPDSQVEQDESKDPWEVLGFYLEAFQLMMEMRAGKTKISLPFKKSPTEAIDKHCDQWIAAFLDAKDRSQIVPPPYLIKWLATRAFAGMLCLELEKGDGAAVPDVKSNLEGEMKKRLIDAWHGRMKQLWPMIDPKNGKGQSTGGKFPTNTGQ